MLYPLNQSEQQDKDMQKDISMKLYVTSGKFK